VAGSRKANTERTHYGANEEWPPAGRRFPASARLKDHKLYALRPALMVRTGDISL
jgi:hypothetical protein